MPANQTLPIRLAIVATAAQTFEEDVRTGTIPRASWEDEKLSYLAKAEQRLEQSGQSLPVSSEDSPIVVDRKSDCTADLAVRFLDAIDAWQLLQMANDAMGNHACTPFPSPEAFLVAAAKPSRGVNRGNSVQPAQLLGGPRAAQGH